VIALPYHTAIAQPQSQHESQASQQNQPHPHAIRAVSKAALARSLLWQHITRLNWQDP